MPATSCSPPAPANRTPCSSSCSAIPDRPCWCPSRAIRCSTTWPSLEGLVAAPLSPGFRRALAHRLPKPGFHRRAAIVVVSPNNPTGSYLGAEDCDRLAALAAEHGLAVIADEVFADFPWRPRPMRWWRWRTAGPALTFSLGGLSKASGLPQMKLGWIAATGPREARSARARQPGTGGRHLFVRRHARATGAAQVARARRRHPPRHSPARAAQPPIAGKPHRCALALHAAARRGGLVRHPARARDHERRRLGAAPAPRPRRARATRLLLRYAPGRHAGAQPADTARDLRPRRIELLTLAVMCESGLMHSFRAGRAWTRSKRRTCWSGWAVALVVAGLLLSTSPARALELHSFIDDRCQVSTGVLVRVDEARVHFITLEGGYATLPVGCRWEWLSSTRFWRIRSHASPSTSRCARWRGGFAPAPTTNRASSAGPWGSTTNSSSFSTPRGARMFSNPRIFIVSRRCADMPAQLLPTVFAKVALDFPPELLPCAASTLRIRLAPKPGAW
jgi:hypothetical protein